MNVMPIPNCILSPIFQKFDNLILRYRRWIKGGNVNKYLFPYMIIHLLFTFTTKQRNSFILVFWFPIAKHVDSLLSAHLWVICNPLCDHSCCSVVAASVCLVMLALFLGLVVQRESFSKHCDTIKPYFYLFYYFWWFNNPGTVTTTTI